jgi:hypothetical protein|uniref:Uncharacterized protein n=1 Tax=Populus trichocarpa TaxID=3694 RepID=A0A2K1WZA7_POPTR
MVESKGVYTKNIRFDPEQFLRDVCSLFLQSKKGALFQPSTKTKISCRVTSPERTSPSLLNLDQINLMFQNFVKVRVN